MGLFGILKAPGKILNRLTGATNSHKQMNIVRDDMERTRNNLLHTNRVAREKNEQLQKMLEELSGMDREQKSLHKDYKNRVKTLGYEERNLKGLGQHYSKAIGKMESKGNELLTRKTQLEERNLKLEEKAIPFEEKLKEITEGVKHLDGGEIKNLIEEYQQKFREAELNKEKLKGVSRETSPELFTQHQKMVKGLELLHKKTEQTVKSKHGGLSEGHQKLAQKLNLLQKDYFELESEGKDIRRGQEKLERKQQYINTYQNILEPEINRFSESQEEFKKEAEGLKVFQEKLDQLEQGYATKKSQAELLQKELVGMGSSQEQLANQLRGLQGTLDFIGDRYQHQSGNAKLLGGVGTALLSLATLGTGGLGTLVGGLGSLGVMNSLQKDMEQNLKKWGVYQDIESDPLLSGENRIPDWNKTPLNRLDFKSRVFDTKIKMPEFGRLAQSIKHFEMPTLPTLSELPQLSEVLGKIRSSEDIANLGILPGSTARSPNRSLLNPQLMQAFSSLLKSGRGNKTKKGTFRTLPLLPSGGMGYGY